MNKHYLVSVLTFAVALLSLVVVAVSLFYILRPVVKVEPKVERVLVYVTPTATPSASLKLHGSVVR